MIKNRVDIKDFILQIERDFPVNNWKMNDIHIWPYLRIKLFFYLINKIESNRDFSKAEVQKKIKKGFLVRFKLKIENLFKILKSFAWHKSLPKADYVFVGSDFHRVNFKNRRYNRYFDTLIESNQKYQNSFFFEYQSNSNKQFNKASIYKFDNALKSFLMLKRVKKNIEFQFEEYQDFLAYLDEKKIFKDFVLNNSKHNVINWMSKSFLLKIDFFKSVLNRVSPKEIFILCYYAEEVLPLVVAANQLGIKTTEMQHGPQTHIHLCYSNWSKLPQEGYDVLPRNYWCWDSSSTNIVCNWIKDNNFYSAFDKGNPWVEYWKRNNNNYKFKDFILYSLQPNPFTINQLFSPQIIQLIRESKRKWFVRLHPRQISDLDRIKDVLSKNGVIDNVNLIDASNDPLPLLLANSFIHITHSSGTALEASFFGVKTILINEIGLKSFPHLIENNSAIFIDYLDVDFFDKIKNKLKLDDFKNN